MSCFALVFSHLNIRLVPRCKYRSCSPYRQLHAQGD
ncbi:unnamed protein product [Rhodiola kirilowii]